MSTRCQVRVEGGDNHPYDTVTLYHCDGYPTTILPLVASALDGKQADWHLGRAGHAAAHIIATDVDGYEPEAGHALHGDIKWYYVVNVGGGDHGAPRILVSWTVRVYDVARGATVENPGRLVLQEMGVIEAARRAEEFECRVE